MAGARLRQRRARVARLPGRRAALTVATALTVVIAALIGGALALNTFQQRKELSVGTIELSVDPGRTASLDLYVPLVDWGVRFDQVIRLPARLNVELRTVNRGVVTRVTEGGSLDVNDVRDEARDAIASYLKLLILVSVASAAALASLVAFALRGPMLRVTAAVAVVSAVGWGAALVVLLPPRGPIDKPQYYAFGPTSRARSRPSRRRSARARSWTRSSTRSSSASRGS